MGKSSIEQGVLLLLISTSLQSAQPVDLGYWRQLDKEGKIVYIPLMEREKAKELIEQGAEKAKLEVARNMLAKGIAPELVVEIIGLPEGRIKRLVH
jgi:hypothetical protein